jgi:hypothetical protein
MERLFTTAAVIALTVVISPLAWAQSNPNGQSGTTQMDTNGTNAGSGPGGTVTSNPNRRDTDTRLNSQATSSPGAAGPVEGGTNSAAPAALPKVNSNGERGGVQNPGLGSGINGSSPSR